MSANQQEQLFSLKEWMAAISNKLDRMDIKLDGKADLTQVVQIDSRLTRVESKLIEGETEARFLLPQHARLIEDVGAIKTKMAAVHSVETYKKWVWGTAFGTALAAISALVSIIRP